MSRQPYDFVPVNERQVNNIVFIFTFMQLTLNQNAYVMDYNKSSFNIHRHKVNFGENGSVGTDVHRPNIKHGIENKTFRNW